MKPWRWSLWPPNFLLVAWLHAARFGCQTTVPVFLPGYGNGDWEALRGSIIASVVMAQKLPIEKNGKKGGLEWIRISFG